MSLCYNAPWVSLKFRNSRIFHKFWTILSNFLSDFYHLVNGVLLPVFDVYCTDSAHQKFQLSFVENLQQIQLDKLVEALQKRLHLLLDPILGEKRQRVSASMVLFVTLFKDQFLRGPKGIRKWPFGSDMSNAIEGGTYHWSTILAKKIVTILSLLTRWNMIFCLYGAFLENSLSKQNVPSPHMLSVCMQGEGESFLFF